MYVCAYVQVHVCVFTIDIYHSTSWQVCFVFFKLINPLIIVLFEVLVGLYNLVCVSFVFLFCFVDVRILCTK